jgi:methionyl-tRNA formyltransferase
MRLVFAGTPEVALPSLRAIADSRHELVGVVTRPDAPAGRGRRLAPSAVARFAADLGVPVLTPDHPRDAGFQADLRELAPDCCPVVAYGAILPRSVLDVPRHGWVNLHFSLLPAWRGAAPVQRALWSGDPVTGATTFRIVPSLDAGPTYGVVTERIRPDDTAGDLLTRLAEVGGSLLVATLDGIEDGRLQARPQPEEGVSLAPKVEVAEAEVVWGRPAYAVDRQVRACTPAPGAWTTHAGSRLKLGPVRIDPEGPRVAPGEVAVTKHTVHVGTGSEPVRLGAVRPHGRKEMPAADWARGARLADGARLGGSVGGPVR